MAAQQRVALIVANYMTDGQCNFRCGSICDCGANGHDVARWALAMDAAKQILEALAEERGLPEVDQ